MASSQKHIPKDAGGLPVSSHYNASADRHDPTQGASGAARIRIADGNHEAIGSRDDAPSSGDLTGSFSVVSLLKEWVSLTREL